MHLVDGRRFWYRGRSGWGSRTAKRLLLRLQISQLFFEELVLGLRSSGALLGVGQLLARIVNVADLFEDARPGVDRDHHLTRFRRGPTRVLSLRSGRVDGLGTAFQMVRSCGPFRQRSLGVRSRKGLYPRASMTAVGWMSSTGYPSSRGK